MNNFNTVINNITKIDKKHLINIKNLEKRVKYLYSITYILKIIKTLFPNLINVDDKDNKKITFVINLMMNIFKKYQVHYDFNIVNDKNIDLLNSYSEIEDKYNKQIKLIDMSILDNIKSIQNIDINFSSGGNAGFYGVGLISVLNYLKKKEKITINRISGVSIGSWIGLFFLSELPINVIIKIYNYFLKTFTSNPEPLLNYMYDIWKLYLEKNLPKDFYKKCNNKLFICYTELNSNGFNMKIKSNYNSNNDIFLHCVASSAIPFMTIDGSCININNNKCIDGAFIQQIYKFPDSINEINVDFNYIDYNSKLYLMPLDNNINELIIKGTVDSINYFRGKNSKIIY